MTDISQPVIGRPVAVRTVRLGDLQLDRRYQRSLSRAWQQRLVRELREEYMPPLALSERPGGVLYVLDGQHRLATLLERHGPDALVRALVYSGLSFDQERMLFFILNKALQVSRQHVHRVGDAIDAGVEGLIADALARYGLEGRIGSLRVLQEIAESGGEYGLERTLAIVAFAWRDEARKVHRDMLRGLWLALKADETADEELAMGLLQAGPREIEQAALRHRVRLDCSRTMACTLAFQEAARPV